MRFTELTEEQAQAIIEEEIAANTVPDVDDFSPFRPRKADPVSSKARRPMQGFRQSKARGILSKEQAMRMINGF